MEKSPEEKQNQVSKVNLWDCGSTLYDSFELNSFKRQLDSAISNSPRTLSMPHLPERRLQLEPPPPSQPRPPSSNKSFKISRSLQKFLRFVFKSSNKSNTTISRSSSNRSSTATAATTTSFHQVPERYSKDRFYVVYDKSSEPVLSTIPELPEFEIGGLSPEISSLVRKSASERFTATAIGISCA